LGSRVIVDPRPGHAWLVPHCAGPPRGRSSRQNRRGGFARHAEKAPAGGRQFHFDHMLNGSAETPGQFISPISVFDSVPR